MSKDVPEHIAIIMDGNRRWAELQGLSSYEGHAAGAETLVRTLYDAKDLGVKIMTAFGFSSENWRRSNEEVEFLLLLALKNIREQREELNHEGVRFRVLGSRQGLSQNLIKEIDETEKLSANNQDFRFNFAFNYGGRWDIVQAAKKLATQVSLGHLDVDDIDESCLTAQMQACKDSDPDLLIRTSGEQRISNFLLWNLAYSEFVFVPTHWPDFNKSHLMKILEDVAKRKRRFGA